MIKKNTISKQTSASIEKQTALFLEAGGSIQLIANGVSGQNIQGSYHTSSKSAHQKTADQKS